MLYISAAFAVVQCLFVRLVAWVSVTFVHCVETTKDRVRVTAES